MADMLDELYQQVKKLHADIMRMHTESDNMIDIAKLSVDCVARIATGKSPDPRKDALETMRALQVFALDGLEMQRNNPPRG